MNTEREQDEATVTLDAATHPTLDAATHPTTEKVTAHPTKEEATTEAKDFNGRAKPKTSRIRRVVKRAYRTVHILGELNMACIGFTVEQGPTAVCVERLSPILYTVKEEWEYIGVALESLYKEYPGIDNITVNVSIHD